MKKLSKNYLFILLIILVVSCKETTIEENEIMSNNNLLEEIGDVSCAPSQHDGIVYYTEYDPETEQMVEYSYEYNVDVFSNEDNLVTNYGDGNNDFGIEINYTDVGLIERFMYTYGNSAEANSYQFVTEASYNNQELDGISFNGDIGALNEGDINTVSGTIDVEYNSEGKRFIAELENGELAKLQTYHSADGFTEWIIEYSADSFKSQNEKIMFYRLFLQNYDVEGFGMILSGNKIPSTVITNYGDTYTFDVEYNNEGYIESIKKNSEGESSDVFGYTYNCM